MNRQKLTRAWLYFRTGYAYYFVFIVSGLNALMIAYFVVILGTECEAGKSLTEQGDVLCLLRWAFPHFAYFVAFTIAVGIPSLVGIGYWHYKNHQLGTHAYIEWSKNPYQKVTLQLFLQMVQELKRTTKYGKETNKNLDEIEKSLLKLLGDKKLE